jgi:hypothetical protein
MRNVSEDFVQKIKTHFIFHNFKNRAVDEICGKSIVELGRPPMTVWSMRIACSILKIKNTQSKYVILSAFPLLKWLHECASILGCISC